MKSVIYCFTGTGNSLTVAWKIAEELGNCEVLPMTSKHYENTDFDNIGFVYPVYFQGIPLAVKEFVNGMKIHNKKAYFFAVATYGGLAGNGTAQLKQLLSEKGVVLSYGSYLKMFSNYVVMYNMSKNVSSSIIKSDQDLERILKEVTARKVRPVRKSLGILEWYYKKREQAVPGMDKDYNISEKCTGCGICSKVCPVENITMSENEPVFQHHCEQCMACIQYCPKRALNYKNITQSRRRYTNPSVKVQDLMEFYSK